MTTRRTVLATAGVGLGTLLAHPWTAVGTQTKDSGHEPPTVQWRRLPDLPPNRTVWTDKLPIGEPYWRQVGLAGPVAGMHNDHLIVAGGANFPEPARTSNRAPILGKVYWSDAFILQMRSDGTTEWLDGAFQLRDAVSYAACISTEKGVLVIGGEGHRGGPGSSATATIEKFADVFLLKYDEVGSKLFREDLPSLPRPLSYGAAARVGDTVFVAEGSEFFSLDLNDTARGWSTLETWPGAPRSVAVAASDGSHFYLLSGRSQLADGTWQFYTDAYAYEPLRRRWTQIADLPWCITAGLAMGSGDGIVALAGDRDLGRWEVIQDLTARRDAETMGSAEWIRGNDLITWIYDHHTGFNTEILRYEPKCDRWSPAGFFPGAPQVTTPAIGWGERTIIASGEIRPGVRTPTMWSVRTGSLR